MNSFSETAQDRAYNHVKSQILSLALRPGEWVKAQDVAAAVNVSRTPVREALGRLEQEGYVQRNGGWGYVVRSVTLQEAREFYKVREALEAEAVREAVAHVTDQELTILDALLQKAEEGRASGRVQTFRKYARSFHARIALNAGNSLLAGMLSQLEDRSHQLAMMVFDKHHHRMDEVVEENRAIFEAIKARDCARAEAAVRHHVQQGWATYFRYVADGASSTA